MVLGGPCCERRRPHAQMAGSQFAGVARDATLSCRGTVPWRPRTLPRLVEPTSSAASSGSTHSAGFPRPLRKTCAASTNARSAHLREGGFAAQDAYEDLLRAIEIYDPNPFLAHFPKVEVIRGDFEATNGRYLEEHPHLVISLLYLDFDLYAPTRTAIEQLASRVPRGGVIAFDELNDEAFPGETIAAIDAMGLPSLRLRRFQFEPRICYAVIGD